MRIGLLGMGTIGSGVYEIVEARGDMEIARVLDLRKIAGLGDRLTHRFEDIFGLADRVSVFLSLIHI